MKYQLVVQFCCRDNADFDRLIEIEETLEENLLGQHEVDGHDFGSGEMNLFILTDAPGSALEIVKTVLRSTSWVELDKVKIAYREMQSENYVCLWPKDLTNFEVK